MSRVRKRDGRCLSAGSAENVPAEDAGALPALRIYELSSVLRMRGTVYRYIITSPGIAYLEYQRHSEPFEVGDEVTTLDSQWNERFTGQVRREVVNREEKIGASYRR